jgi:hypothetical protein
MNIVTYESSNSTVNIRKMLDVMEIEAENLRRNLSLGAVQIGAEISNPIIEITVSDWSEENSNGGV